MIIALSFAFLAAAAQADQPVVQMTGPNGVTSTMPLELGGMDARLGQASDLVAKGQPAAALPLIDQVIAEFEGKYRSSTRTVYYSARSMEEGFIYSTLAGMANRNGVVLNGDWATAYFLKGFALVDLNRSDEAIRWFDKAAVLAPMNAQVLADVVGELRIGAAGEDLNAIRIHIAHPLTLLPNRTLFGDRLAHALLQSRRQAL